MSEESNIDGLDSAERPQEGSPKKGFWAGLNKTVRDAGDLAKSGAKSALDAVSMLSPVPSDKVNTYKSKVTELLKELGVDFDGGFTENSNGNFGGNFNIGDYKYYISISKGGNGIALFRNDMPLTVNGNFVRAEKGNWLGFSKVKNALKKDKIVSEQNARISEMLGKLGIIDSGHLVEYKDEVTREFSIFNNKYSFIINAKGIGISLGRMIVEGDKKSMAYLQQDGTLSKSKVYLDNLTIEAFLQKEIDDAERLKEEYKNEFSNILSRVTNIGYSRVTNIGYIGEVEIDLKGNPYQYFYIGDYSYRISKDINGEGMGIIKRGDKPLALQENGTFVESDDYVYLDISIVINALREEDRRVTEEIIIADEKRVNKALEVLKNQVTYMFTNAGITIRDFVKYNKGFLFFFTLRDKTYRLYFDLEGLAISEKTDKGLTYLNINDDGIFVENDKSYYLPLQRVEIALKNLVAEPASDDIDALFAASVEGATGGNDSIVGAGGEDTTTGNDDIPAFLRGDGLTDDITITGDDLAGGEDTVVGTGGDLTGGEEESEIITTATQENGISDELASLVKILGISEEQGENIKEIDKLEGDKRKIAMSLLNKNISPNEVLNIMSLVNTIPESFLGALAKTLEEITEDAIVSNLNLESAKKGDNFERGDFVYRKVNSGWQQLPKGTLLAGVSHFEGNIISSNEITGNLNMTFIKTYIENFVKSMVTSMDEFKKFKKGDHFEFGEFVYRKVNSGWQQLPKGTLLAGVSHFEGNIISDDEVLFNFVLYKDSNNTMPKATEEVVKTEEAVNTPDAEIIAAVNETIADTKSVIPESKKIPSKEDIINAEKGYNFEFKDFVYRRVYNGWQQLPKGTSLAKTSILAGKVLNNEELLKIVFENSSEKINSESGLREKILEAKVGDSFEFGDFVYRKGGKVWQQFPKGTLLATTSISDGKIITNDELLAITKSFKSGEVLYVNGESIIYVGK